MRKIFIALCVLICIFSCQTHAEGAMIEVETETDGDAGNFLVSILNESNYLMSVSLIYFDQNVLKMRCRGWWNVEPHSERRIALNHRKGQPIFYYVECQDRAYSKTKSDKGLDWRVSKMKFSYVMGDAAGLVNPYRVHFVRGGPTNAGWWRLTIK